MIEEKIREFNVESSDGEELKLRIRRPTNKEVELGDFEYSRAFVNAVSKGIPPQATLVRVLEENGYWTKEKDNEILRQRDLVESLENEFENTKQKKKKESLRHELSLARDTFYLMRQEKNALFSHTADQKASDAQRDFIISQVVEYADGKKVWSSFEDYKNEEDGNLLYRCTYEFLTFSNGMSSTFLEELPENKDDEDENSGEDVTSEEKTPQGTKKKIEITEETTS